MCEDQMVRYMWKYFVGSILQYVKYYYVKKIEVCVFFKKSMVYLGIILSKALKMSRKKNIAFF